jgi:D-aminoacyl-tRNA deacylase
MLAVVQRVREAAVTIDGNVESHIGSGLLVLLGVSHEDAEQEAVWLAKKVANLRIFADENDKMNRSLLDAGGECLVVSQFTLHGDCRKGNRPSFIRAAPPETAIPLYERFVELLRAHGITVRTGVFGAMMEVALVNNGPVTILLASPNETSG